MKKLLYTVLIILLCLTSFMLISCDGEEDTTTTVDNEDNKTTVKSHEFSITYKLDGGTNNTENPNGYNTGDTVSLAFPEKEYYMFAGWYTDSALTNEIKEIKDREESLTLYAKWIPCQYVFNFIESNGYYEIDIAPKYVVETVIIPSTYKGMPVVSVKMPVSEYVEYVRTIYISDSVKHIEAGLGVSMGSTKFSLEYIGVDPKNPKYKSVDGVLYSKDGKNLVRYPTNKIDESFAIPDGVTSIHQLAFYRCENLKSITIPDGVTSIGIGAFNQAVSLESIVIPDTVKKIERAAFYKCNSLKSVTLPNSIEAIYTETFSFCTSLEHIEFPNSLKVIESWAFNDCYSLENIVMTNSVTSIGDCAFYKCTSLEGVVIPSSVVTLDGTTFKDCPQIILYCEAESMPKGWESHLSRNVKEIVWGYKESNR
ncbi:MAG: leucine-rich repeat protein [Clostridia bacterium]|nr:leucine-rich repeat protein [Clostridia bacterium]